MERAAPLTDRRGRSSSRQYGSETPAEEWSQDGFEHGRRFRTKAQGCGHDVRGLAVDGARISRRSPESERRIRTGVPLFRDDDLLWPDATTGF